ncbi:MAG: zinc ribbon domain-containing protein [Actinomycetaceae bacterium]|nr:zinc ribbon domain-containing protein [Actinomycetaceae bacterium]
MSNTPNYQSPYEDSSQPKRYDVQTWRKVVYYLGMAVTGLGFLIFAMPFLSFALFQFGTPEWMENLPGAQPESPFSSAPIAFRLIPMSFVGFFFIAGGNFLTRLGKKGLAGSGVILSPKGEVADAEPWQRSEGAQMQDKFEEVPILRDALAGRGGGSEPQIRVRCRSCGELDTEDARFCSGCGAPMA